MRRSENLRNRLLAVPVLFSAEVLSACTSSSSGPITVVDPPRLSIDSISTVGGTPWFPGSECLAPGTDPEATIAVNVGPNDHTGHLLSSSKLPISWTLSPPLTCIGIPPCGFLKLTIDTCISADSASCDVTSNTPSERTIVSAGPSISVQMARATDAGPRAPSGFFRFRVGLYNPDATIVEDPAGHTFPAEAVVELRQDCNGAMPPPPPIADASTDTGIHDAAIDVHRADVGVVAPADAATDTGIVVPDARVPTDARPPTDARRPTDARVPDAAPHVDSGPIPVPHDAQTTG